MKRTFKETSWFTKKWYDLGFTNMDLVELQNVLLEDPKIGDVIQGTGGLRKIRIPLRGKGKRGGGRVIYVDIDVKETIHLIDVYVKNRKEDLSPEEKKALRTVLGLIREED